YLDALDEQHMTKKQLGKRNRNKKKVDPSYITYLDANNLYGHAMSEYLPHDDFKWRTDIETFTTNYIHSIGNNADKGFFFEVDLHYPVHLHDLHNELPCAVEPIKVSKDMQSPYCKRIVEENDLKCGRV